LGPWDALEDGDEVSAGWDVVLRRDGDIVDDRQQQRAGQRAGLDVAALGENLGLGRVIVVERQVQSHAQSETSRVPTWPRTRPRACRS